MFEAIQSCARSYTEATVTGISAAPALFTAINKDRADLRHELVPFDTALTQRMSERAVRILQATDAGDLPPRIADSRDFFACRFGAHAGRCWGLLQAGLSVSDRTLPHLGPWSTAGAVWTRCRHLETGCHQSFCHDPLTD